MEPNFAAYTVAEEGGFTLVIHMHGFPSIADAESLLADMMSPYQTYMPKIGTVH